MEPDRVFYDDNGKIYKAKKATAPTHAEMNFAPDDIRTVLTDKPISREEMVGKINALGHEKKEPVITRITPEDKIDV